VQRLQKLAAGQREIKGEELLLHKRIVLGLLHVLPKRKRAASLNGIPEQKKKSRLGELESGKGEPSRARLYQMTLPEATPKK